MEANFSVPLLNGHVSQDGDAAFKEIIGNAICCCTALCQSIVVFGIVTNIINIICFVKQGFKDQINISLSGK